MDHQNDKIKGKTASGMRWVLLGKFSEKAISFCTMIVLARILVPEEFGLFIMGMVAVEALGYTKSLGIDAALIQRRTQVEESASTAFFLLTVIGILLYSVLYIVSPWLGTLLGNPAVVPVIQLLGVTVLLGSLGRVPLSLMDKNFLFHKKMAAEVSGQVINSVIAVTLALQGAGVWCLVYGYLAKQAWIVIICMGLSGWKPRLVFNRVLASELIRYGKFILGSSTLGYLNANLDKVVVGRILGTASLGLYGLSFNIASALPEYLRISFVRVLFPVYAAIQDQPEKLREAFLKSLTYLSLIYLPACVVLFLLAEDFISVVYGARWVPAAVALQILVFYGFFRTISDAAMPIFRAVGKPRLDFQVTSVQVIVLVLGLIPLVKLFGILGAGMALTLSGFSGVVQSLYRVRQTVHCGLDSILKAILPGCAGSIVMGGIVWIIQWTLYRTMEASLLPIAQLAGVFLAGLIAYVCFMWCINPGLLSRARSDLFRAKA